MFSKDSLKLKIQTAVTVALIASGIIPAVQAEVTDENVDNPSGTTITNGVDLSSDGPYTVINAGTITAASKDFDVSAIEIDEVAVTTLTNSGEISGTSYGSGLGGYGIYLNGKFNYDNETSITTLTNTEDGTISGSAYNIGARGYGIYLYGYHGDVSINTLTNSGTISGKEAQYAYGIHLYGYYGDVSINTLTNSGTISGTSSGSDGYGIYINPDSYYSVVTINTLTNTGTISGNTHDIKSQPSTLNIVNLNNSQGKEGNDVLTYNGKLPTNYNVIVNSTSDYGQVSFTAESGTTNFGVSSSSTFSGAATYASVISGLATETLGQPDQEL